MLVERLKKKYNANEPIFTAEILEMFKEYSRAYIFRLIEKAEIKKEIIRFDTGIYYLPTTNIMGLSTITTEDVVNKKYICDKDEVYGIYGGLNLQNMFSTTTQMPNMIEVISNKESMRCRKVIIDGRTIIVRKSRCKINNKNNNEYMILQLFTEVGKNYTLDNRAKKVIKEFIKDNNIKKESLINLAKFFPAITIKNLFCSGVLNEFA